MPRDLRYITDKFKKNMSEKLKGNNNAFGHNVCLSQDARDRISLKLKGIKRSEETRRKMSLAQKGRKISSDAKKKMSLAAIKRHYKPWGVLNYYEIHSRIRRMYGEPRSCEECGTTKAKFYDWSNVSLKYKKSRSDWKRLCRPCHGRHDSSKRSNKRRNLSLKRRVNRRSNNHGFKNKGNG